MNESTCIIKSEDYRCGYLDYDSARDVWHCDEFNEDVPQPEVEKLQECLDKYGWGDE